MSKPLGTPHTVQLEVVGQPHVEHVCDGLDLLLPKQAVPQSSRTCNISMPGMAAAAGLQMPSSMLR